MKQTLPILIIIFLMSCSSEKKTDISEQGMHGNVSKISESRYEAIEKFGEVSKGRLASTTVIEVDANGNFNKEIYTSMPDPKYDTIIGYKSTKDVFVTISKFNKNGKRIAVIDAKSGKVSDKYSYDADGNCIEVDQFDDNKLTSKTKYLFQDGHLKQASKYNSDGTLENIKRFKLNGEEKVIEADEFTSEEKLRGYVTNSFNDKGLIADYKIYVGRRLDGNGSFKYLTFDEHDNWTKRYHLVKGKIEDVIERKIEYR